MATQPVTEITVVGKDVAAGEIKTMTFPADSTVPAVLGQVCVWDPSGINFVPFATAVAGGFYGVFYDERLVSSTGATLGTDAHALFIIGGDVDLYTLDATFRAAGWDARAVLANCGIRALEGVSAVAL